ncbi:LOW QUALITY PROTEIN: putative ROK-family transcriptional regulator [Geomicrobium sp. JCM 19037]|nr:LOW QUALITY PROTEIN: putative ROK-family transcriptional regulator [Geomicrobium sp. JCM 19037]
MFHTIRLQRKASKNLISVQNDVSATTVNTVVQNLLENNFIQEDGIGHSTGGRKPLLYKVNDDIRYVICASLKDHTMTFAKVSLGGVVLDRFTSSVQSLTGEAYIQKFLKEIDQFIAHLDDCMAISVILPGVIEADRGVVLYNAQLKIYEYPLKQSLQQLYAVPIYIENDTNSFVTAERYMGALHEENVLYVTIGDGVGGGLLVNGSIHRGQHGAAGEIGHMTVVQNGVLCSCNNRGCLESYVSWPAIRGRIISLLMARRSETCLHEWVGNQYEKITPEMFIRAVQNDDPLSIVINNEVAEYVATAFINVLHLLSPDMIVLSGKVVQGNDQLVTRVQQIVEERKLPALASKTNIKLTSLSEEVELFGALSVACSDQIPLAQQINYEGNVCNVHLLLD